MPQLAMVMEPSVFGTHMPFGQTLSLGMNHDHFVAFTLSQNDLNRGMVFHKHVLYNQVPKELACTKNV